MKPRMALLLADWPAADRLAWERANAASDDLFSEGKAAKELRPRTLDTHVQVYGLWLDFLGRTGCLVPGESPAQRVTPERLGAWCADQRARENRPWTLRSRLISLYGAMLRMLPDEDWSFIIRPGGLPLRRAIPAVAKPWVPYDVADIMRHVRRLHAQGLAGEGYAQGAAALRDAALMGFLLSRAPRIGPVSAMRLGQELTETDDGCYFVDLPPGTSKTKRRLSYPLDIETSAMMRDYLTHGRPQFSGAAATDALWLGTRGQPLNVGGLSKIVIRSTTAWLGRPYGPHALRKWLRSSAARRSPEAAFDAAEVLGHSPRVSVQHYAAANGLDAVIRHGKHIAKLRRETAGLADRLFAMDRARGPKAKARGQYDDST